jgi:serine/threonine protein phosphatase PrpC
MEIITDSILEKGSSHDICEDYILHGITKEYNIPYIILSDGCSSSKHTDIGARILVHGIKKQIENHFCFLPEEMINDDMYNYLQPNIIYTANSIINSLQLANSCLDCTLIFAFIINEKCYIFRYGDGSIITEYDNGMININTLQFLPCFS